jgi:hypothetical protein
MNPHAFWHGGFLFFRPILRADSIAFHYITDNAVSPYHFSNCNAAMNMALHLSALVVNARYAAYSFGCFAGLLGEIGKD